MSSNLTESLETLLDSHSIPEVLSEIASICYRESRLLTCIGGYRRLGIKYQLWAQKIDVLAIHLGALPRNGEKQDHATYHP